MSEQHAKQPNRSQVVVDLAILAGGKSLRMGEDKALLEVAGRSLLVHHLQQFREQVNTLWLVGDIQRNVALPKNAKLLADFLPKQEGPLSGLLAALKASEADFLWLVSCDSYGLDAAIFQKMQDELIASGIDSVDGADIACLEVAACLQPLLAVLRRVAVIESLQAYLQEGERAVMPWLKRQQLLVHRYLGDSIFCNINTPEQYQQLLQSVESNAK
jgi:molybdopterin-guanine dinucleotide biosynthesis protein A